MLATSLAIPRQAPQRASPPRRKIRVRPGYEDGAPSQSLRRCGGAVPEIARDPHRRRTEREHDRRIPRGEEAPELVADARVRRSAVVEGRAADADIGRPVWLRGRQLRIEQRQVAKRENCPSNIASCVVGGSPSSRRKSRSGASHERTLRLKSSTGVTGPTGPVVVTRQRKRAIGGRGSPFPGERSSRPGCGAAYVAVQERMRRFAAQAAALRHRQTRVLRASRFDADGRLWGRIENLRQRDFAGARVVAPAARLALELVAGRRTRSARVAKLTVVQQPGIQPRDVRGRAAGSQRCSASISTLLFAWPALLTMRAPGESTPHA